MNRLRGGALIPRGVYRFADHEGGLRPFEHRGTHAIATEASARRNASLPAVSDCGADFSSRQCEPSPAAFTNGLLQLAQPFYGPHYGIEVRCPFPRLALQLLAETGLRFTGADP